MAMTSSPADDIFTPKPVTVSSTSSMETAGSIQSDRVAVLEGTQRFSSEPSIVRSFPQQSQPVGTTHYGVQSSAITSAPSSIGMVPSPLRSPAAGIVVPSLTSTNTVPEFLYQLTKMLTDNNREIIEWSNGKIEVHNPHKLQTHVLNRYFRHSKFASFQRQLNYFGFRKLAGKGKMAPCSYVNDATTQELRSLLHIKRKTGNEPKSKSAANKKSSQASSADKAASSGARGAQHVNPDPAMSGMLNLPGDTSMGTQPQHSQQQALARVAVGKGIRHSFSLPKYESSILPAKGAAAIDTNAVASQSPIQAGLSALTSNFKNSMQETDPQQSSEAQQPLSMLSYVPGSLRRDDSLVDLAMIPMVDGESQNDDQSTATGLAFIDFPWDPSFLQNNA